MSDSKLLIYLLRRDLRVADNPILHSLRTQPDHGFTHLLPLYIFPAQQVEVSGFIQEGRKSPYPEARSQVGGFWRCGPHRAKFLAESVWDVKEGLEKVGSGLCIRAGMVGDVIKNMLEESKEGSIGAVWMTGEEGVEEKREEREVKKACAKAGVECKIWVDEKYLLDDRDLHGIQDPQDLPNVFTTYRKMMEPLREAPRAVLPTAVKDSLPLFSTDLIPPQTLPFEIPETLDAIISGLQKPLNATPIIKDPPTYPEGAQTSHPFQGGETKAIERLRHILKSGTITSYKETRNGMLGADFSSKLSAYLALGCLTARQVHASTLAFEDGTDDAFSGAPGYGKGQNEGTGSMRFELLWRDYMRLCTRKYGPRLFHLSGFKQKSDVEEKWSSPRNPHGRSKEELQGMIERFLNGTTGMGLVDASQREMYHTGYTSNRARQNVASFLAKHLYIDWRIGAEWYECMLVDYDLSSNWGNWQYVAGVGNDPRDDARVFNPVKQSFDYDPGAEYIKTWTPETRDCEPAQAFQLWTVPDAEREAKGLLGLPMVEQPLKKIEFTVGRRATVNRGRGGGGKKRPGNGGNRGGGQRGGGPGGQGRGNDNPPRSYYGARGYGSASSHLPRGYHGGRSGGEGCGGREARTGMVDKERAAGLDFQQV